MKDWFPPTVDELNSESRQVNYASAQTGLKHRTFLGPSCYLVWALGCSA